MIELKCTNCDATIRLDIKDPNDRGSIQVTGSEYLREQLSWATGFRGHTFHPDSCTGFDLIAVLINQGIKYEIIQGADILDMPEWEIPEGAID